MMELDPADFDGTMRRLAAAVGLESGSQPKYRYYETPGGWQFGWTTERYEGGRYRGKFVAFCYQPVGSGSRVGRRRAIEAARADLRRGGRGIVLRMKLVRETPRRARRACKRLAWGWYVARLRREAASSAPYARESARALAREEAWSGP